MERTAAGLEELGHRVRAVEGAGREDSFDVVHAFGSEPSVWHFLRHWTRNPCPLVVTPVVVVSPGAEEALLRILARVPVLTHARMKADVVQRADAVIAGTRYERRVVTGGLGADPEKVGVIGNAARVHDRERLPASPEAVGEGPFALMVGSISPRKRQEEVLRALAGRVRVVVAGGFVGDAGERARWERTVRESGAVWLGDVSDEQHVAALQRDASALILFSAAEVQSLAVLETLALGTPVVLSDIPSHRELLATYPELVRVIRRVRDVGDAVAELEGAKPREAPPVPSWTDVAREIGSVYRDVVG